MPYRALIVTLVTVTIALLAVGMWARSISPMLAEANAATQPSEVPGLSHPAAPVYVPTSTAPVPPEKQLKRLVKGTLILSFVLICMLFVVGFFASFREWVRYRTLAPSRPAQKTAFVDAWKIAGERLQTPPLDSESPDDDSASPPPNKA